VSEVVVNGGSLRKWLSAILVHSKRFASLSEFPLPLRYLWLVAPAGYLALMGVAIAHHEPWADEAQAWLLARDSNPISLMKDFLPYEGTPGLWHLLLMVPAKLLPYQTLNVISGALAALATYLVLRHSPFPLIAKVLLPFTYFLFFQYGVVARSYALLAPLLFLVAVKYQERHQKPWLYAGLLLLLANVSAHGFLISGALMLLNVLHLVHEWPELDPPLRKKNLKPIAGYGVLMALLALTLRPPPNRTGAINWPEAMGGPLAFWREAGHMLTDSMTNSLLILLPVMVISLWFFWRRRVLALYLLPTFWIIVFATYIYQAVWHRGTLFIVWVFAIWVGLQQHQKGSKQDSWSRLLLLSALVLVCLVQLPWTVGSVRSDFSHAYSGSKAAARYIKAHSLDKGVLWGTGFSSVAILPYFENNIFDNYHKGLKPSFWLWSDSNDMVQNSKDVEGVRPDHVILSIKVPNAEQFMVLYPSYRVREKFPGLIYWKEVDVETEEFLLLQRKGPTVPSTARE
jgi:hypothetical protein